MEFNMDNWRRIDVDAPEIALGHDDEVARAGAQMSPSRMWRDGT